MRDSNRHLLTETARLLRPLFDEMVFVGGSIVGLLITDAAVPTVRATGDADVIVEITSYAEYGCFGERLRALGFKEDMSDGAPLCRWRQSESVLDAMPLDRVTAAPDALRAYLAQELRILMRDSRFIDALPLICRPTHRANRGCPSS